MRSRVASVAVLALLASVGVALSCGPVEEDLGRWTLDHRDYAGKYGLPLLSPGNDTRINLQLLMLDEGKPPAARQLPPVDANAINPAPALFDMAELAGAFAKSGGAGGEAEDESQTAGLAYGEGSRCISLKDGAQAFKSAVEADKRLSDTERGLLVAARTNMKPTCDDAKGAKQALPDPLAGVARPSPASREFAAYLAGSWSFYVGDFDSALTHFGEVAKSDNAWLREAARYMTARNLLNKAQVGAFDTFDTVGQPKVADKASLAASETEFKAYLAAYPAGKYAASAQGLMRRIYWLADDRPRLGAEYGRLIAQAPKLQANFARVSLAEEIDAKFLTAARDDAQTRDPEILAVEDLKRMRSDPQTKAKFPAADLDRQAPDFAGREKLFAFLKAARAYYVDADPRATLALLGPAATGVLSPPFLAFSAEALRGQALMASGDLQAAVDHWKGLAPRADQPWQKEAVELGLALSWQKLGTIDKVFLPGTRIASTRIRQVLLRRTAGPILLRMALADPLSTQGERNLVRAVLLFKEATRGQYGNFLRDFKPDELQRDAGDASDGWSAEAKKFLWPGQTETYSCPALKAVIAELAARPHASRALLCLGDFVRTQGLDDFESRQPGSDELGGGKSIFPGQPYSRGEVYKTLIAARGTPDKERAYALYRAIHCYAPTGRNGCGGAEVDKSERKRWFSMLKSRYGATEWAQETRYYW